jgi:negative regulator of replication initiation
MKYYKVEIDEEVWDYIKSQAEPLIDTVNSVLRRLLLGGQSTKSPAYKSADNNFGPLDLPRNIPRSLAQILEVIHEVRYNKRQRPEATRIVAQRYGTTPQTILDKYCRQLGKKANEIDELLDESDLEEFRHLLVNKFPNYVDLILRILQATHQQSEDSDITIKRKKLVTETNKELLKTGKLYSIDDLTKMDLGKNTRPMFIKINEDQFDVDDWTELCVKFVEWLIMKGILKESNVPIFNHAKREKYFINTERKHLFAERDAHWKSVGEFYVDTKYNADAHVKNLMSTLRDLNAGNIELKIAFRD